MVKIEFLMGMRKFSRKSWIRDFRHATREIEITVVFQRSLMALGSGRVGFPSRGGDENHWIPVDRLVKLSAMVSE
ncbi:hypothetical protein G3N57_21115 [Paraburkholderia sp. Se-20369]|nr:hypothetical protein [Paraburkholderia sp. Se-20369]